MKYRDPLILLSLFLLPIALVLFVFRETIFVSAIPSLLDVLINYFPYYNALYSPHHTIQQGIISGFPLLVSVSTTWFNPINELFFYFFDAFDAFRLLNITYLIGAYVFSYLYAKRIHLSHYAAILVGLIYIFSGQVLLWSEAIIMTSYYFLLPLILYILDFAFSYQKLSRWLLVILAGALLGLGWLTGHVQFVIYLHLFFLAYWLFKSFLGSDLKNWRYLTEQGGMLLLMFGISYIVGYPLISAILDFLPLTERVGGVSLSMMYAHAYMPYHIIHYFLPSFSLQSPIPYQTALQNYIGILPLLILLFGLFHFRKIASRSSESGFFLGAGIFCLLASIKYSPIVFIFHYLPLFKTFREAPRIMFIGNFALAIFIGFTIDYVSAHKEFFKESISGSLRACRKYFYWIVSPIIFAFSVLYIFFFHTIEKFLNNYYVSRLSEHSTGGYPIEHYYNIIHLRLAKTLGQFSILNRDIIIMIIFLIASYWLLKNIQQLSRQTFLMLTVVIVALNFCILYANRMQSIRRHEYLELPASAKLILRHEKLEEPFRVFSPFNDTALFNESTRCSFPELSGWDISYPDFMLRRELTEPNLNMVYGIESADGYEPYMPVRISDIIGYLGSRFSVTNRYDMNLGAEQIPVKEKVKKFIERKNILRSLNVKYVISHFQITDVDFKELMSEQIGECGSQVYVYELTNSWPRYFLIDKVVIMKDDANIFKNYMDAINATKQPTVFIENEQDSLTGGNSVIEKVTPQIDSNLIRFTVSGQNSRFLFIGNAWLPGWRATIDGKPADIIKANYIYMGLHIPSGAHEIVFQYE